MAMMPGNSDAAAEGKSRSAVPMVRPFPQPGPLLKLAYWELKAAVDGTHEHKRKLGDSSLLPRPWDPASVTHPLLRKELWEWLDDVVIWVNTEYVWDVDAMVPACWPHHPHLARELAVLADQRRQAADTTDSDSLEEWHRYSLPAFQQRMRSRLGVHCDDGHQPWPAKGRHARHTGPAASRERQTTFAGDTGALTSEEANKGGASVGPRLRVLDGHEVDSVTGEVYD
ncbi:hypothetical protein [Lapillicoccus sp.]|uniref:hypothetical protein n=1 Tax=Lapillicoccus sp. TaxID=1909287 RepID=UPI0025F93472|nr:hypothetical protein [Lapillicoccus sp.]